MPETVTAPVKSRSPTVWTPDQARLAAKKSAQSRKALAVQRRRAIKQAANNPFQTVPAQPPAEQPQAPTIDRFASDRLARVRKQLIKLDSMLSHACDDPDLDASHIDKFASAIARLSEIERQLADRPLPGSRRPAPEKSAQSRASLLLGPSTDQPVQGRVEQE